MDHAELLDRLVDAEVVTQAGDGAYAVTADVSDQVRAVEADLADGRDPAAVALQAGVSDHPDLLATVADDDPTFVAQYCVLADRLPSLAHRTLLRLALLVDRLEALADPPAGVPDGFLPLSGPRFLTAVELCGHGIGYVYQPDCDPCEAVSDSLERLAAATDDAVALLAVDGSQWPERLFDRLDVRGAPTTLFVRAGRVDARLESAQPHAAYERELARTVQQAEDVSTPRDT